MGAKDSGRSGGVGSSIGDNVCLRVMSMLALGLSIMLERLLASYPYPFLAAVLITHGFSTQDASIAIAADFVCGFFAYGFALFAQLFFARSRSSASSSSSSSS